MRLFLLILLFIISFNTLGQRLIKTPYESRMEAKAMANLVFKLEDEMKKERMMIWKPYNRVKFTMKTRFNTSLLDKVDFKDGIGSLFSGFEMDDIWSLGAYDIRCRVYINKKVKFMTRLLVSGINYDQYFYSSGFILKF